MRTKDHTGAYCFFWLLSLYIVYVAAMVITVENYSARRKPDIVVRLRTRGARTVRTGRRATRQRLCFTH